MNIWKIHAAVPGLDVPFYIRSEHQPTDAEIKAVWRQQSPGSELKSTADTKDLPLSECYPGYTRVEMLEVVDIPTAPLLTRQEAFDIAITALRKQGRRSMVGGLCRYRGADGCKCAFGHLIPDDQYDEKLERRLVGDQHLRAANAALGDRGFYTDMQHHLHDLISTEPFLPELERNAVAFAERYRLTYTAPETVPC